MQKTKSLFVFTIFAVLAICVENARGGDIIAKNGTVSLAPLSYKWIKLEFTGTDLIGNHLVEITRQPAQGRITFPFGPVISKERLQNEKDDDFIIRHSLLPGPKQDVKTWFVWCKYQADVPNSLIADSFEWHVTGPFGRSNPGRVAITIVVNTPPVAHNGSLVATSDTPLQKSVNYYDQDAGQPMKSKVLIAPKHGMLTWDPVDPRKFTYIPQKGYEGVDQFVYRIEDGIDVSAPATISIQVKAPTSMLSSVAGNGMGEYGIGGGGSFVMPPSVSGHVFDIYVEAGLQASIQASLDVYMADLTNESYLVTVQEFSGTAAELRAQLSNRWVNAGLEGALFIGDLPAQIFTHNNDFGGTETFIHDLYFMDLDGEYLLAGSPDQHYNGNGDVAPEIYVSRITTSTMTNLTGKTESQLINDYFAKVHNYRTNAVAYTHRGIVWADDDWQFYGGYVMNGLYSETLTVNNPATTTGPNYWNTLSLNYESILEMIHSATTYHATSGGSTSYAKIYTLNPRIAFYNMYNCKSAIFTVNNNLICTYVYSGDYGLNAIGSTKTGSMLTFNSFYYPQAEGRTLGEAFMDWFIPNATETTPGGDYNASWFYGMTMQGDPTLRALGHQPSLDYRSSFVNDPSGNQDGFMNQGETVDLTVTLYNSGIALAKGVTATLSSTNSAVIITDNTAAFNDILRENEMVASDPFQLKITNSCSTPLNINLLMLVTDTNNIVCSNNFVVTIYTSSIVSGQVVEATGGLPVTGAEIRYRGPYSGSVTTDVNGNYSFTAVNGSYIVAAGKNGYTKEHTFATFPPGQTIDLMLGNPKITVSPTNLVVSAHKGTTITNQLLISNTGDVSLVYGIYTNASDNTIANTNLLYWWEEIISTGTRISEMSEDNIISSQIPIGFAFPYFGITYTNLYVSDNGWISFDPHNDALNNNSSMPSVYSGAPSNAIAFFWDDLNFVKSGDAYYETIDTNTFVITFNNVAIKNRSATITAQLILKSDGSIICQYQDIGYADYSTVGFQDRSKTIGHYAVYNTYTAIVPTNGLAIYMYPSAVIDTDWVTVSQGSGVIVAGSNNTTDVLFDTSDLMTGSYTSVLSVVCNDINAHFIDIPLVFTVTGNATNHAPIVTNTIAYINEDSTTNIVLTPNDVDGDTMFLKIIDNPTNGYFVSKTLSSLIYHPNFNYNGPDSFTFKVNDYEVDSNIATVQVTVVSVPDMPYVYWTAPVSGSSYNFMEAISFSASVYDPDGADNILRVEFKTTNGFEIGTNFYDGDTTYTFTNGLYNGNHSLLAVVYDADGLVSTSSLVNITVLPNNPPVADAGQDHSVEGIREITLDGSGSTDADGHTLTYLWEQVTNGATSVTISNANQAVASFIPVTNDIYAFKLNVSDGYNSNTDLVTITVSLDTTPPEISMVSANVESSKVLVLYNEPVDAITATNILYYTVNKGVSVLAAELNADAQSVVLSVSSLETNAMYILTVNNVTDLAWSKNSIVPNTQVSFQARVAFPGWGHRMKITFGGYDKDEPLIDFPVAVLFSNNISGSGFDYTQFSSGTGDDLRFTDATGINELNYEIEEWKTNSISTVWVQLPVLSSNAYIWAYWGNTNAITPPAYTTNGAVWTAGFIAVWHLNQTNSNGNFIDSTGNGYYGKNYGASNTNGAVANGQSFNGSSDYTALNMSYAGVNSITQIMVEAWFNTTFAGVSRADNWAFIDFDRSEYYDFYIAGDTRRLAFSTYSNGGIIDDFEGNTPSLNDGAWHYACAIYDGTDKTLYLNGTADGTAANPHAGANLGSTLTRYGIIGDGSEATSFNGTRNYNYYKGMMDELRVSNVARSSNWVWACWLNQSGNGGFITYTSIETVIEPDNDSDGIADSIDPDDDNDGIPDVWEIANNLNHLNASDAGLDPDGDGFTNIEEYIAGTDPWMQISTFEVQCAPASGVTNCVKFDTELNRLYGVEYKDELIIGVWLSLTNNIEGTGGSVKIEDSNQAGKRKRFYRIKVKLK